MHRIGLQGVPPKDKNATLELSKITHSSAYEKKSKYIFDKYFNDLVNHLQSLLRTEVRNDHSCN